MAVVLESRFNKDQILELYLNDVTLGQRGPFEIRGVAEAARILFGKDIRNVTLAESATMAGLIQSPVFLSPFRNPDRARERRNVVLKEMADVEVITREEAVARLQGAASRGDARARERSAVFRRLRESTGRRKVQRPARSAIARWTSTRRSTCTCSAFAQEAVDEGVAQVDKLLAKKKKGSAQVALVAVDPTTGEILALVGGRGVQPIAVQPRRRRATSARVRVQAVRLPRGVRTNRRRHDAPHAGDDHRRRADELPVQREAVRAGQLPGRIRRADYAPAGAGAFAQHRRDQSRRSSRLRERRGTRGKRIGLGTPAQPYPSIALGVFEVTPLEMATAYTIFTNAGSMRPLQAITRIVDNGTETAVPRAAAQADHPARRDLPRHQHDAERHQRGHGGGRAERLLATTRPARPARPTICATPGSWASRRRC